MTERREIRTRISKGYQVVVPSELRKEYGVAEGDEVIWVASDQGVTTEFRKRPSIANIIGLGSSRERDNSVALKKRIQKGEF
ncbi:MAG: AbrB/MazE/SpoVT family DNA-binding domain-containing protein [Thaumarchaeota archaeon]|nr:AbrB/MazE/SpoVT family DNA-binding domain-containing protein [Nitrososphaerota archaeon]